MNPESPMYRRRLGTLLVVAGQDGTYEAVCRKCGERTTVSGESIRDKTATCVRGCKS